MADILAFVKAAIAALLALLGITVDADAAEEFVDNVKSGVEDVVDYGNSLVD